VEKGGTYFLQTEKRERKGSLVDLTSHLFDSGGFKGSQGAIDSPFRCKKKHSREKRENFWEKRGNQSGLALLRKNFQKKSSCPLDRVRDPPLLFEPGSKLSRVSIIILFLP